jgi:hypothetical protein
MKQEAEAKRLQRERNAFMSAYVRNTDAALAEHHRKLAERFGPGNPGPKGSRNKLGEAFIEALHDDFENTASRPSRRCGGEPWRLRPRDRLAAAERVQDRNHERPDR